MTARLRDALRSTAEGVPAYPVYERALATARRDRRRRLAAAAAVVTLLALAGVALPLARTPALDPAAAGDAALPDRIALPPIGTLHVTDRPRLGPASVIFDGRAPRLHGWNDVNVVGVVDADSDRYRIMRMGGESLAGELVHLSPDGRYLARPRRPGRPGRRRHRPGHRPHPAAGVDRRPQCVEHAGRLVRRRRLAGGPRRRAGRVRRRHLHHRAERGDR
ncbi:hypothetical protein [Micromonospora lupini]|uniref:Uncharacterized protein n=1 Tax=Micromonospora lupini str. Lupac 08 TaxID=1150864 RepID=I0L7Q5_9ACTN|nr:hypothetical protein [Micromonospora lupini]CCH19852.1 Protein of unknown function [Micromonospora lupini str. Lupac 08]